MPNLRVHVIALTRQATRSTHLVFDAMPDPIREAHRPCTEKANLGAPPIIRTRAEVS